MYFQNETLHPEAEELTALLFKVAGQDPEERAYDVVDGLVMGRYIEGTLVGRSTEAGGDLYALIVESGWADTDKVGAVSIISRCLWQNQKHYPRG